MNFQELCPIVEMDDGTKTLDLSRAARLAALKNTASRDQFFEAFRDWRADVHGAPYAKALAAIDDEGAKVLVEEGIHAKAEADLSVLRKLTATAREAAENELDQLLVKLGQSNPILWGLRVTWEDPKTARISVSRVQGKRKSATSKVATVRLADGEVE